MARKLYLDTTDRVFVKSPTDASRLIPSEFFDGDNETLEVYFLEQTGIFGAPYAYIDKSGAGLKCGLGQRRSVLTAGTWLVIQNTAATSGVLIVGKRYKIVAFVSGDDFSNVGASANESGVLFVATGTTPTTWTHSSQLKEVTADLSYSISETDLSTAVNATNWLGTVAGGVAVKKGANTPRYTVTFTLNGSQDALEIVTSSLIPSASGIISERIPGNPSTREVQTIFLSVNPPVYQGTFTDLSTTVTATVTEEAGGSSSENEVQKIAYSRPPSSGSQTITFPSYTRDVTAAVVAGVFETTENHGFTEQQLITASGFTNPSGFTNDSNMYVRVIDATRFYLCLIPNTPQTGFTADAGSGVITTFTRTTGAIPYSATLVDIQTACAALESVGSGNLSISGVVGKYVLLSYVGAKALASFPEVTCQVSGMTAPPGKTGAFDLATFGLGDLFDAQTGDTLDLVFEAELTDGGEITTTQADCQVTEEVIRALVLSPSATGSYYTSDEIDAMFADPSFFAALDLSGLPTSNPGGGKPWLNGGVLQVGA